MKTDEVVKKKFGGAEK